MNQLDQVLQGGLPAGTITEIAGPSGCGKTQMCMLLSVLATLPQQNGGLGGGVIYLDTESALSAQRIIEISQNRFPDLFSTEKSLLKLSKDIHVYVESTCQSLLKRLEQLEEEIITHKIQLVILDSIASLVRKEFDSGRNLIERTNLVIKQATILKKLAEDFKIPVVVTNQITTRFGSGPTSSSVSSWEQDVSLQGDAGYVTAALGNTWSHAVNTRLILQYLDGPRRQVLIAKSPLAPFATFAYTIQAGGLYLEEGGAEHYEGTDPGLQKIRVRTSIPQDAFQL